MTPEELRNQMNGLELEEHEIHMKLMALRQSYADLVCPHHVGDVIEHRGRQIKITNITYLSYEPDYMLRGKWILKNGQEGKEVHELCTLLQSNGG